MAKRRSVFTLILMGMVCGGCVVKKDFAKHDYYGNKPIDPPYCIVEGKVYMPSCPEEGGHLMVWKHGKWVRADATKP